MGDAMIQAFKRCGYKLVEEKLDFRLQQLSEDLSVSPAWMAGRFEVFMSSREYTREVNEELVDGFEEFAKQQSKKENKLETKAVPSPAARAKPAVLADHTNRRQSTPGNALPKTKLRPDLPGSSPTPAKQGGVVTSSLNAHLLIPDRNTGDARRRDRCIITRVGAEVKPSAKILMDRIQDKVAYLEGNINRFAEAVEASEGVSLANSVHVPSQEPLWYVGRICCDSEGKLNENSLLLEGSIRHSQGHRVRLDLSKLQSFRVFPGQVVAVEGVNPNGDRLIAMRMIHSQATARPQQLESRLEAPESGTGGASIVVASGPYTFRGNLDYEPLKELLAFCTQQKPDVLLLMGPFVDVEHPLISSAQTDRLFEDIFQESVLGQLTTVDPDMTVVLMPSTRDVHHLPVFPQPPLEASTPENVVLLGNPSTFRCNNITFGAVTTDVLKHLSSQEIDRGNTGDRIAGLASHIVHQQSYYPIFPPALGTMLDTTLSESLQLPHTPDVLLLPSDLNSFAKLVDGAASERVVCINPGRLLKGNGRGSFAHLQVADVMSQGDSADGVQQSFAKNCRVDIKLL